MTRRIRKFKVKDKYSFFTSRLCAIFMGILIKCVDLQFLPLVKIDFKIFAFVPIFEHL